MDGPVASEKLVIAKPVAEVFDAVINRNKIDKYFVSSASADMTEGAVVHWRWEEFNVGGDATIGRIEENKSVTFYWKAAGKFDTAIEITFESSTNGQKTLITCKESGFPFTLEGANTCAGQAGGWMHFLLSMKGYLEHGINLREGGVWTLN